MENIRLFEASLLNDGSYGIGFDYIKNIKNMKIAFTGSSGSGKTTLVKFVEKEFGLKHISGSAGDILTESDKARLVHSFGYNGGNGHNGVIQKSAASIAFGVNFQELLQMRRWELISNNNDFVTDRSPLDNLTYFISQLGFHREIGDDYIEGFSNRCLQAWCELSHVIYVRAVQPGPIENNGSRIPNKWYQQSSDAQFNYWLRSFFMKYRIQRIGLELRKPKVLIIDYWDLDKRKEELGRFLREPREIVKPPHNPNIPTAFG
jgi:hypothetical protein